MFSNSMMKSGCKIIFKWWNFPSGKESSKKIQVSGNLVSVGWWKFSKCRFDKKNFKSSDEKLSKCWPKEVLKILPSWDFSQKLFLVNSKISEETIWLKVASNLFLEDDGDCLHNVRCMMRGNSSKCQFFLNRFYKCRLEQKFLDGRFF